MPEKSNLLKQVILMRKSLYGNCQAEIAFSFIEHQPFVHHHLQKRPHLFFSKTWKPGTNLLEGSLCPAKQIDLSGSIFQPMGHVMPFSASLPNDHKIPAVLKRENGAAPRLFMEPQIVLSPLFYLSLHRTPQAILVSHSTLVALNDEPEATQNFLWKK